MNIQDNTILGLKKKISWLIASLAGLLLISVIGTVFFIQSSTFHSFLLKQVNQSIPGHLSWEKLTLSVFSGTIEIKKIQLQDPQGESIARIPLLSLDLSLKHLFYKEIFLSSVLIQSPTLNLKHSGQGVLNIVSATVPDTPDEDPAASDPVRPFPLNVRIHHLAVNNGAVDFKANDPDLSASVSGVDLALSDVDLAKPSVNVALVIREGAVRRDKISIDVSSFRFDAHFFKNHLTNIFLQTDFNGCTVAVKGNIRDLLTVPVLDMTLDATVDTDVAGRAFNLGTHADGPAVMTLMVKGSLENPEADLELTYGPGTVANQSIESIMLHSTLRDRILAIQPSRLQAGWGNLFLDGTIRLKEVFSDGFLKSRPDMDQVTFDMNIRPDLTDPGQLPFMEGMLNGGISSDIRLTGKGAIPGNIQADLQADIHTRQLVFQAAHAPLDLQIQARAGLSSNGRIDLKELHVAHKDSTIEAQGHLDLFDQEFNVNDSKPLNLDISFDVVTLADIFPDQGLGGTFSGTINLAGNLFAPVMTAAIEGKRLAAQAITIGDVLVEMTFSDGVLALEQAGIINQNSQLNIQGQIGLFTPGTLEMEGSPRVDLVVSSDAIQLEDFSKDMKGKITINGQIKGNPEQHDGRLAIEAGLLEIYGQPLEKVSGSATIHNQNIDIDRLEVQIDPAARVTAKGRVALVDNTMDLKIVSAGFDLTRLKPLRQDGILQRADLSLDMTVRGRMDDPLMDGHLQVQNIEIFNEKSDPVDLAFELKNNLLQVAGKAGPDVTGTYHMDTKEFSVGLAMDALPLEPYLKLAGLSQLAGTISGNIHAGGRADRLDDVTVTADLSDVTLVMNQEPLLTIKPANASYHAGLLTLPGVRVDFETGGALTIKGRGTLDQALDFEAAGSIPFGILPSLSDEIRTASGTINITAFVKGTIQDPLLQADLEFNDLALAAEFIGSEFSHITGHIRVTPREVEIVRFAGQLDKGEYTLGGRVQIDQGGIQHFDLKFDARQLVLDFPDMMELTLDSRLILSGVPEKSQLTGEIILLEGLYYRDVKLDLLTAATRRTRKISPSSPKKDNVFLENMLLDVNIRHQGLLLVENNLASLQISPDITIQGTAHTPLLAGRASVDSGVLTFNKAEFEVKKGIIDFVNPYRIEPLIDIAGEMSIRSWIITLTVSGTPDNLDLQFTSVPSESHADIISLIVFGKTTREMGNAAGGQFSSEEFVSGLLAEALEKNLRDATGIDELKIDTDRSDESGSSGVQVTVGKELSRRMSVAYGVDIRDGETVQQVTTYYRLMENLLISGFQDSGGKFGGEVKYRLEFR